MPAATAERVKGMVEIRDTVRELIAMQMEESVTDEEIHKQQEKLNQVYDAYTAKYGVIGSNANKRAFSDDASYCLLCSLEDLNEDGTLKRKADMFTKRTIKKAVAVTSVETATEALALSLNERAKVDLSYMAQLTGKTEEKITEELVGVIFKNPLTDQWESGDEYLSGNVREKLNTARTFAENHPEFTPNVRALEAVQPRELEASEIEVRIGATWIEPSDYQDFMRELLHTPWYLAQKEITFAFFSGWHTGGKSIFMADTITDPADFMVAPLIGNILVMINKTCCIKDDVVMDMIFINMGAYHIFIFSFQYFVCKLLP